MTKMYPKENIALAIASKLSKKGIEHEVFEQDGQYGVRPVGGVIETNEGEFSTTIAMETAEVIEPKAKVVSILDQVVTVDIPGARESKGYVYTPKMEGKERWFATKSLVAFEAIEIDGQVGLRLTLTKRALKSRGLDQYGQVEAA
jgi:hypothetical protein